MCSLKYILKQGFSSEITCIFRIRKDLETEQLKFIFQGLFRCLRCPKKLILSAVLSFHFSVFSLFPFRFRTTHFAISKKRFQIIFYVSVFYSVFQSCIFSAIDDRSLRDFPISEFRVFQFFFVNQMPELLFRLFLAVLYFVNFTSRIRIIRNNHIEFADGKLKLKNLLFRIRNLCFEQQMSFIILPFISLKIRSITAFLSSIESS